MTKEQRTVAIGAVSGIVMMVVLVWAIGTYLPAPNVQDAYGDRIGYALRWSVVAALPLFFMTAAVGNSRFLGKAIDPTKHKEDPKLLVNGRVADNTTQQFLLFLVGIMALSTTLPIARISYVAAVAITFVICRLVFWIGYRIHPLYRAPGFSSTAYLNLGMFVAVLWIRLST
jgi:MAPEG family.